MDVTIIGAGHVGLVTAAVFAQLGRRVCVLDHDRRLIERLKAGLLHFYEPGFAEMLGRVRTAGKVRYAHSLEEDGSTADAFVICVGTPSAPDGTVDLGGIYAAVLSLCPYLRADTLLVIKSTVPPGTTAAIAEFLAGRGVKAHLAIAPEFFREGSAVRDALAPQRIVVGATTRQAVARMRRLHAHVRTTWVVTTPLNAEFIKYAANAFLALKISFINELARLAEAIGADITEVARGIGTDPRIGEAFLGAGVGFGGSCLPKDARALIRLGEKTGARLTILEKVLEVNSRQADHAVGLLQRALTTLEGRNVAVWGLAFKPDTDDLRESPALAVVRRLLDRGARVQAYDPVVTSCPEMPDMTICANPYDAVRNADAVAFLTDWAEFSRVNFHHARALMKHPVVLDGRNALDAAALTAAGFTYIGLGRRSHFGGREVGADGR